MGAGATLPRCLHRNVGLLRFRTVVWPCFVTNPDNLVSNTHTMQLAACCRSLGLTATPAPHDFTHTARLLRCALALVACLGPVSAPRPRDMALLEGLVQSQVLAELAYLLQRLMPAHNESESEPCSCCRPEAPAWSRIVSFEQRAAGAAGAGNST